MNKVLAGQYDHLFINIVNSIHCMSRPRVYAVLNAIVSCMDEGELYLEVGTYQGGSLISALTGNNAKAIGVDSFSEFKETNSFERTLDNLFKFGVDKRVVLWDEDYKDYFKKDIKPDTRIQVYYYDGEHGYEPQLAGMEACWGYLHTGSFILVDDYSYPEVRRAVNQFITNHIDHIGIQFVMAPMGEFENMGETWWNGYVVLRVF